MSTAGVDRATVVVDTGSGPVWSACITFDGTISGIEALRLAEATIPGLSPVLEVEAGIGRAVCRLLGVGNDPPNCLTKSVEYWAYFRNGQYSRVGASSAVVRDGDVEGWSFSRGTAPRTATTGTEAVPLSDVPTTTTTPPATTAPGGGQASPPTSVPTASQPGSHPGTTAQPGGGSDPGDGDGSGGGADPAAEDPAGPGSATAGDANDDPVIGADDDEEGDDPVAAGGEGARGSGGLVDDGDGSAVTITTKDDGEGSSVASMVGFGGVMGLAGLAVVLVRRRRQAASAEIPVDHGS